MVAIIVSTTIDGEYADVGDLLFTPGPSGTHSARFTYDPEFVRRGWAIDPALPLDPAPHTLRGLPLAFEDASPDTWGELLLQRAERNTAAETGRDSQRLTPDQFLLGASDITRQGALRFRTEQDGPYLGEDADVPTILDVGQLLQASVDVAENPHSADWEPFAKLLGAGTSALGGARPKAAVVGEDGALWLAKFPRIGDQNDVPLWEMVALDIAERAGLRVPERQLIDVLGRKVLLLQRFDRTAGGERIHYMSTRTLMGTRDLGTFADYGTRTGIATRLARISGASRDDLPLLWKQAVLNVLINNTDNHLRNHGLVLEDGHWRLAPVFDLDPNPDVGTQFNTHFNGAAYRTTALRGLLDIAAQFDLRPAPAIAALGEVHAAVTGWDTDARAYGARQVEIDLLTAAFTGLDETVGRLATSGA
ncbi:MAG: type II toxin-antitoxin system HipA family toxin [Propionibacteriales bacterium]|nr:type II toxin-antitoxin system HipA family toxin [Propionibacteriales bacterium]